MAGHDGVRPSATTNTAPSGVSSGRRQPAGDDVLSARALNRALLERQLLLGRVRRSALETVEHLVGMQAQIPGAPYYSLWARLDGFRPDDLSDLIAGRRAVRTSLMRSTIHLVTADDCLALYPVIRPVLSRTLHSGSPFGRRTAGVDSNTLVAAARALLDERSRTKAELGRLLHESWPDHDAEALAYAVQLQTPLVQVPPRGLWGQSGQPTHATAERWLGRPLASETAPDRLVLRYLAAFGPATVGDVQAWSGLAGLRDVVERLRPALRTLRDERGRELFDLPDAPLPDPETPAAVRLLGDYDNVLLAHADRSRIIPERHRAEVVPNIGRPPVLVDGFVRGWWKLTRERDVATLRVELFEPVPEPDHTALIEESRRLLAFAAPDAARTDVRITCLA